MMKWKEVKEDLFKNHNHSWYQEIYNRNKNFLDQEALEMRGTSITYGEYFAEVEKYAKALKSYGVNKGDEFVAMVRQTPDYAILFGAASLIGAKINFAHPKFDKEYLSSIIERSNSNIVFCNNWDFAEVSSSLKKSTQNKTIVSLPVEKWDKLNNPFSEITDRFFVFDEEKYKSVKSEFSNVIETDEFLRHGESYNGELDGHGTLEDDTVICYTSGTTKPGIHKGVPLKNKTYIVMGRYHDKEVTGMPTMKNIRTLIGIDTQADVTLLSGLSDTFMQGGTMVLDPIVDSDYYAYSLLLNKAQFAIATRTTWLRVMKCYYYNEDLKGATLPYLYVPSEGGEPLCGGEEVALNRWAKKVKAGIKITKTPKSITKFTLGGGDTENGNIFVQLFRAYKNGLQKIRGIKEPIGLDVYDFAEVKALREDGTYCEPGEIGHLVAKSEIAMDGYRYEEDSEASKNFHVTDAYGNVWGDLSNYGYIDKYGHVYYKGRINNKQLEVNTFELQDVICRDTKNIMSCEVVYVDGAYVAHVEFQLDKKINYEKVLLSAEARCHSIFKNLDTNLYFRIREHEEGFPISSVTKRDVKAVEKEGISDKCFIPSEIFSYENNESLGKKL